MKPPFSYYGGKQRMLHNILPLIPKHTVYVEPFCGGATVLFGKPWPNVSNGTYYREIINDTNGDLINFFRVLQDKSKAAELCHMIDFTLYSREEYEKARLNQGDDIKKAWCFYVNVSMSFGNKVNGGWGTRASSENGGATWAKNKNLRAYINRLQPIHIEKLDAIEVIKKWDSPQTLFYCDPPYPGTRQGHYNGYANEDFKKLIHALDTCEGSFLLSCYDNDEVPEQWEHFTFEAVCSVNNTKGAEGDKSRIEHIWRVVRNQNVRPELMKLFQSGAFDCYPGDNIRSQTELF